jgi:hypothetical protein
MSITLPIELQSMITNSYLKECKNDVKHNNLMEQICDMEIYMMIFRTYSNNVWYGYQPHLHQPYSRIRAAIYALENYIEPFMHGY